MFSPLPIHGLTTSLNTFSIGVPNSITFISFIPTAIKVSPATHHENEHKVEIQALNSK
jgi:hypothetical protein